MINITSKILVTIKELIRKSSVQDACGYYHLNHFRECERINTCHVLLKLLILLIRKDFVGFTFWNLKNLPGIHYFIHPFKHFIIWHIILTHDLMFRLYNYFSLLNIKKKINKQSINILSVPLSFSFFTNKSI